MISLLNFGFFWFHTHFLKIFSSSSNVFWFGDGRDSRICVIFGINKHFINFILPYGVKFLELHIYINFRISFILLLIFMSVILLKSSTLYSIRSEINSFVQSKFNPSQNFTLLPLHPPIFITLVFSLLILNPLMFSNSFKIDMLVLMEVSFALVKSVVSSAYWDILCSCLYIVSPSIFLLDLMASAKTFGCHYEKIRGYLIPLPTSPP